jgi:uncharacterized protein (TIGR02611 family)
MAKHKNVHAMMDKFRHFLRLDKLPPTVRKVLVTVVGGVIFLAGIVMLVTPGPAFILIPLGLLLLSSEFKWAERWTQKALDAVHKVRVRWRAWRRRRAQARA